MPRAPFDGARRVVRARCRPAHPRGAKASERRGATPYASCWVRATSYAFQWSSGADGATPAGGDDRARRRRLTPGELDYVNAHASDAARRCGRCAATPDLGEGRRQSRSAARRRSTGSPWRLRATRPPSAPWRSTTSGAGLGHLGTRSDSAALLPALLGANGHYRRVLSLVGFGGLNSALVLGRPKRPDDQRVVRRGERARSVRAAGSVATMGDRPANASAQPASAHATAARGSRDHHRVVIRDRTRWRPAPDRRSGSSRRRSSCELTRDRAADRETKLDVCWPSPRARSRRPHATIKSSESGTSARTPADLPTPAPGPESLRDGRGLPPREP